jgi:hypothetical protein
MVHFSLKNIQKIDFNSSVRYILPVYPCFKKYILFSIISTLFLSAFFLQAGVLKCSLCGNRISRKYIKDQKGRVYCSKKCYLKSLPKCCKCGKPASIHSGEKYYCSKRCLKSTWRRCASCGKRANKGRLRGLDKTFLCLECAMKPQCFACSMPGVFELADGRYICEKCNETAVFKESKAIEIAENVRNIMRDSLLLSTDHNINYHLVSLFELKKKESGKKVTELGLFKFSMTVERITKTTTHGLETKKEIFRKIRSENYDIYFLSGLPLKKLQEVAAHELAHDWMQEQFPNINDDMIREGWAEYVASEVNEILGHSDMNKRMNKNPDEVYGQGYRLIRNYVDDNGINALLESFKDKND